MKKKHNIVVLLMLIILLIISIIYYCINTNIEKPFIYGITVPNSYYSTTSNTEISELGINFMRFDFAWSVIESNKGTYNFIYDENVSKLIKNNISVLAILDYGNKFYVTNNTLIVGGKVGSYVPVYNDEEFEKFKTAYGNYVYNTVLHYKGKIKYYEIWNEPYWAGFGFNYTNDGNISVLRYTQILKEGYTRAKQADPNVVILNGGMGLFAVGKYDLINNYINDMYLYGAKDYFDIMNVHYPNFKQGQIDRLISVMNKYGDYNKKIWITEDNQPSYGCNRNGGTNGVITSCPNYTEINQANYLTSQLSYVKTYTRITSYFVFTLWDGTCSGYNYNECNYGLLKGNYSKKQSFYTYKNIIDGDNT